MDIPIKKTLDRKGPSIDRIAMITQKIFLLFLIFGQSAFAQAPGMLEGEIKDSKGLGIGFANILILKNTDSVVTGSVANTEGMFSIKSPEAGAYFLRITAVGYKTFETPIFTIADANQTNNIGVITLQEDTTQLKEVKIESLRPAITQLSDRMLVKIEGTAMAAGNTAFSVLSRMPGIFVDPEGMIQLNGKSGVSVMLDGKLTYLSSRELRTMLEGMSAENIKNIEIIATPPSNFDAEGTAGIVNIILKKNIKDGMNGNIYSTYINNFSQTGGTYGAGINYKKGKWNSFVNIDGMSIPGGREATFTRVFYAPDKTTYFDQSAVSNSTYNVPPIFSFGADLNLSENHLVGATVRQFNGNYNDSFLTKTLIGDAPNTPYQFVDARNYNEEHPTTYNINLHYRVKLDTIGTSFSTDFDYATVNNRTKGRFNNYFTNLISMEETSDILAATTHSTIDILAIKADYVKPLINNHKIEMGIKASQVTSDNDAKFYFNNGSLILDPLRTNHFNYLERIYAGYFSWNWELNKKIALKAGIRAENTSSIGLSYTTGEETKKSYLNLFPSLFLRQRIMEEYEINYSYSRRITRPNYGRLNPFKIYRDPYTWTEGNPALRPQFTHSFSISQTYKKVYNFTLSYDWDQDVMIEIPYLNVEDGTTTYTTGNVDDRHNFTATLLAPLKITNWWDTQNTGTLWYSKLTTAHENGFLVNKELSYKFKSNHTLKLPYEIRFETNFTYQSSAVNGLYRMDAMHRTDLALKKSFFNKKLDVVVNANDIFKGWRYKWGTNINGNVNDFNQYMRIANVGFTLRYNFSSGAKVTEIETTDIEETKRAN